MSFHALGVDQKQKELLSAEPSPDSESNGSEDEYRRENLTNNVLTEQTQLYYSNLGYCQNVSLDRASHTIEVDPDSTSQSLGPEEVRLFWRESTRRFRTTPMDRFCSPGGVEPFSTLSETIRRGNRSSYASLESVGRRGRVEKRCRRRKRPRSKGSSVRAQRSSSSPPCEDSEGSERNSVASIASSAHASDVRAAGSEFDGTYPQELDFEDARTLCPENYPEFHGTNLECSSEAKLPSSSTLVDGRLNE